MFWLLAAPSPVVNALRGMRTAFLFAAGVPERLLIANGEGLLPPLWLRRHTGPLSEIEKSAAAIQDLVASLGLVRPGDRILDVGCGFGIMAERLEGSMGREGRYLGFDVHGPSVRWAQRHMATSDRRFRFVLGRRLESEWTLPAPDGDADFILAKSLFTHLGDAAARRALSEMERVLAPGGRALLTAFLFEEDQAPRTLFPFPRPEAPVRWKWKARPEAAVAYERLHFSRMLEEAGLTVETFRPGFWPGSERLDAQDVLVISRGRRRPHGLPG
ncbi:MAG: class I SAM-dependent methyltransferase [Acidobacteriota bacterium]